MSIKQNKQTYKHTANGFWGKKEILGGCSKEGEFNTCVCKFMMKLKDILKLYFMKNLYEEWIIFKLVLWAPFLSPTDTFAYQSVLLWKSCFWVLFPVGKSITLAGCQTPGVHVCELDGPSFRVGVPKLSYAKAPKTALASGRGPPSKLTIK